MSLETVTLELDAEQEGLLHRYAAFLGETRDLVAAVPDGSALQVYEDAVVEKGREQQRLLLQHAAQAQGDPAEKQKAVLRTCPWSQYRQNRGRSGCEVLTCLEPVSCGGDRGVLDAVASRATIMLTRRSAWMATSALACNEKLAGPPPSGGCRDLKIAVARKWPEAEPATAAEWESQPLPPPTARVMWVNISATKRFRRSWHARLKRLGLRVMDQLHGLGDRAS